MNPGTARAPVQSHRDDRRRRLMQAIDARRGLKSRGSGRAWINGREVGGTDPRYLHLERTHD
jgi:hypothetical protein